MEAPTTVLAMTGAETVPAQIEALPRDQRIVLLPDGSPLIPMLGIFALGYGAGRRSLAWSALGVVIILGSWQQARNQRENF